MSEQTKWITITVPYTTRELSFEVMDRGWSRAHDGSMSITAIRGRREVRVELNDVYPAIERAAWPAEPATDWQERVLNEVLLLPISKEREERERCAAEIVRYGIPAVAFAIDRAWNEGADAERNAAARAAKVTPTTDWAKRLAEIVEWAAHMSQDPDFLVVAAWEHVPWLLAQLRAVDAAITAAGIPDDGRAPAERAKVLADGYRYAESYRTSWEQQRTLRDAETITRATAQDGLDVLRRAGLAAIATLGGTVPEDAGPETIASTLRELVENARAREGAIAATLRTMGIADDDRPLARRVSGLVAAVRAAGVLTAGGSLGPVAADILRAAEMLRRWESGTTVEHRCEDPKACSLCVAVADLETVAPRARGEHAGTPHYMAPEQRRSPRARGAPEGRREHARRERRLRGGLGGSRRREPRTGAHAAHRESARRARVLRGVGGDGGLRGVPGRRSAALHAGSGGEHHRRTRRAQGRL